jgi:CO/xanthine dehydrogenase FAD-binding subunit
MRYFDHFDAENFENASQLLKENGKAVAISGGTDIIDVLKEELLEDAPDAVVNLKTIKGSAYITP